MPGQSSSTLPETGKLTVGIEDGFDDVCVADVGLGIVGVGGIAIRSDESVDVLKSSQYLTTLTMEMLSTSSSDELERHPLLLR